MVPAEPLGLIRWTSRRETGPTAPDMFEVATGDEHATLTWAPGALGGPVRYYEYNFKLGDSSATFSTLAADIARWTRVPGGSGARSVVIRGLMNGRSYAFQVRAVNNGGPAFGPVVAKIPSGLPGAPTELTATAGTPTAAGKVTVTLAWMQPEDGGNAISGYEYEIVGFRAWRLTGSTNTFFPITGLDADMVAGYTYRVRAVNDNGVGAIASTDPTDAPIVPGALTFTPATQADIMSGVVAGMPITPMQLPTVTAGMGTAPYTYTATGLPVGLAVSLTGMLTGTPTTAGAFAVTYTAMDSASATGMLTFTITVAAAGTTPTGTPSARRLSSVTVGQLREGGQAQATVTLTGPVEPRRIFKARLRLVGQMHTRQSGIGVGTLASQPSSPDYA